MENNENNRKKFWSVWLTINGIFTLLAFFLRNTVTENFLGSDQQGNWGIMLLCVQVLYHLPGISWKIVGPQHIGVRLFFGKPIDQLSSGPTLIPRGMFQLVLIKRTVSQQELPSNPEKIYRAPSGQPDGVPAHMVKDQFVPPLRVTFGLPTLVHPETNADYTTLLGKYPRTEEEENRLEELYHDLEANKKINAFKASLSAAEKDKDDGEKDPYNRRLNAEVSLLVGWRVTNAIDYLKNLDSDADAKSFIEDRVVGAAVRCLSKVTPAVAQAHIGTMNTIIRDEVEARIRGLGIEIVAFQIKNINYSHDLNEATMKRAGAEAKSKTEAVVARGTAEATRLKAEAERFKLEQEGAGRAQAEKAVLKARTLGLVAMKNQLGVGGETVLGIEGARAITDNPGNKTIIGGSGGFADLLAIASTVGDALKEKNEKKDTTGGTP